jgi:hypothetical protein
MKFYLVILLFSFYAKAGFFSSDYKLDNDPNCFLDLRDVAGDYQETDFIGVYNPLTRAGAVNTAEPVGVTYKIPKFHVFNCIVHKKKPNLRICEGGDEFEYKDSNNDTFKTKVIMARGKFFDVRAKGIRSYKDVKIFADKITFVSRVLSCPERQKWARENRELFIRMYYNPMYIGQ